MPLGSSTRELLFIMRAKDEASRIVASVATAFAAQSEGIDKATKAAQAHGKQMIATGATIAGVGTGFLVAGAAAASFYAGTVKDAADYQKQVAATYTQVTDFSSSMEELGEVGKRVGSQVAVPFEQLQPALFNIFSSLDVNVPQAEKLLLSFSKAAVAGSTDVNTAAKSSIEIMNSFKMSTDDIGHIMDVQFKTTQLGIISYEQYANVIGRATASTEKAGGTIEDLSGILAFLTRNGNSAAMAATAAARGFDLISNPVFEKNMHKLGLTTLDTSGNFRPMVDIVDDLRAKLNSMNEGDRSKALRELTFGAGGTTQAMRFLNAALLDSKGELRSFTEQIYNSNGAMQTAYEKAASTLAAKLEVLRNNWKFLRIEIGNKVIPVLTQIVTVVTKVLQAWDGLNPSIRTAILYGGMITTVLLLLIGIITTVAGVIMILNGAALILGTTLAAASLMFIEIIAVIALVIAAGYLIYRNWDTIKDAALSLWGVLKDVWGKTVDLWWVVVHAVVDGGKSIGAFFTNVFAAVWRWIAGVIKTVVDDIMAVVGALVWFFNNIIVPVLNVLATAFQIAWTIISTTVKVAWAIIGPVLGFVWDIIKVLADVVFFLAQVFVTAFNIIFAVLNFFDAVVSTVVQMVIGLLWVSLKGVIETLVDFFQVSFTIIGSVIMWLWENVTKPYMEAMMWYFSNIVIPIIQFVAGVFVSAFHIIADVVVWWWNNVTKPVLQALVWFFENVIEPALKVLAGIWSVMWSSFGSVVSITWDGIKESLRFGINGAIELLNGFLGASAKVVNGIVDIYNKIPGAPNVEKISAPTIPKLHTGGMVTSAGALNNSEVLRVLQVGEGVVSRKGMDSLGSGGLAAINSGRTGNGVTVAEGAVQITIQGSVDDATLSVMEDRMREMLVSVIQESQAS